LTDFKRRTAEFRDRLRKSGQPEVLTVDGRAELVVQDAAAYEKLLADVEFARTIKGIADGLADSNAGRYKSYEAFDREFRKRFKLPRRS
jgi:hypothetical protein